MVCKNDVFQRKLHLKLGATAGLLWQCLISRNSVGETPVDVVYLCVLFSRKKPCSILAQARKIPILTTLVGSDPFRKSFLTLYLTQ